MSAIEISNNSQNIQIETSIGHSTCTDVTVNKTNVEIITSSENTSTCNTIEIAHRDAPNLEISVSKGDPKPSCNYIDLITTNQHIVEVSSGLDIIFPSVLAENVIGLTQLVQYYINNLNLVDGGTP